VISGGDGGGGIRFTNSFSGGGGAGTTIISGANTYDGDTRFHNADDAIVQLAGGDNRLPTGTTLVFGATATRGRSTLDLNGVNQTVAGITNDVQPSVGTITNTSETRSVLTIDGSTTPTNPFGGVIAGNLDLVKQGSSTLALAGANTFTGNTDVFAGTLLVDGSLAGGVAVASAGTIGGNGTIGGSLVLAGNGSKFIFDPLNTLTVNGASVSFLGDFGIGDLIGLDATTPLGVYTLIDGDATVLTENLLNLGSGNPFDLGGGKSAFFQTGSLQVAVVPEPSTVGLGVAAGLGLAGLAARRRLRKA
jgi:autotransporter-associated beta strand protein